jgi:hypothetical protein
VEGVTGVARRYTEGKLGELVTDVGEGAAVYPPLLQTTEEEKEDA